MIQSCNDDTCLLIETFEDDTFYLQIKDDVTQEDLFFGDNAIYSEEEFEIYIKGVDSLVRYFRWDTFDENTFTVTGNRIYDNLTDTFYIQIPNSTLDTFTLKYYQEDLGKCYGTVVTSYDLQVNGELVCESCKTGEQVIILK